WVFIENERYRKTMEGTSNTFIFIYFSYVFSGGKSGYGMISQLDNKTNNFISLSQDGIGAQKTPIISL
ncbi:MAG: hypothetical protein QOA17_10695, partial [Nitrososphaeraceae archaeon]|nr:hypothetical protein [Nitrososphaeraceae archaeon]